MRPSMDDAWIGRQIAERYRLDRVIGKGGMGTVYEAVHLWTGRSVAVKLLSTDESETASKRILAEARAAAAVRHPHLVEVLDVGTVEEGLMYLVLELLEGESLQAHLRRRDKMRAEDVLDVMVPILDALDALHRASVVHRDVKPGNIFLSRDGVGRVVPKLLDLGISKRLDAEEALTVTGALMGTPSYMSPEQARGAAEVGGSADIWAIGVVLFQCLSGKRPFDHANIPGLLHQIATERPAPLATLVNDLPGGIASAVDRALAYDPADRHATAAAMGDALVNAALAAGWPLTCRVPAGPLISLVPAEPRSVTNVEGWKDASLTPRSDVDATPFGTSVATPISASPSGRLRAPTEGQAEAPVTRANEPEASAQPSGDRARPSGAITKPASPNARADAPITRGDAAAAEGAPVDRSGANEVDAAAEPVDAGAGDDRDAMVPEAALVSTASAAVVPAEGALARAAPGAHEAVEAALPDEAVVLPTQSRAPWLAAGAVGLLLLVGLVYWRLSPEEPQTGPNATEVAARPRVDPVAVPEPPARARGEVPVTPVTPHEVVAAQEPTIPSSAASDTAAPPAETATASLPLGAAGARGRRRAQQPAASSAPLVAPTPATPAPTEGTAAPARGAEPRVREGANRAPIILD